MADGCVCDQMGLSSVTARIGADPVVLRMHERRPQAIAVSILLRMTTDSPDTRGWVEAQHFLLAALLRSVAIAGFVAAATVCSLAFIESWEGSPNFGVATYIFWPMLTGSATLFAMATYRKGAPRAQDVAP